MIDAIAQPLGQACGVASGVIENLVQRTAGDECIGREQQRQIAGILA